MTTWLHFVGRAYYSRAKFEKEARRYGITRRVSLQQLKRMKFGERVLLAMVDGKSSVAFGSFIITTLSGLSREATDAVAEKYTVEQVSAGGVRVKRGCGSYIEGATYNVDATLEQVLEVIEHLDNPGKLMVGGAFESTPSPVVRLKDIRHQQGFRPFDWGGFLADVAAADPKKPTVRGHFYADGIVEQLTAESERRMQIVQDYRRIDDPAQCPKCGADKPAPDAKGTTRCSCGKYTWRMAREE